MNSHDQRDGGNQGSESAGGKGMKDGVIELAGTGITITRVTEIEFPVTVGELEMLIKRLRSLQLGDSTKIFSADGYFEDKPVRFVVRLKQ